MNNSIRSSVALLRAYLLPEWKRVVLLFVLLLSSIGLELVRPQILRDFIDLALGEINVTSIGKVETLTGTAILFFAVAAFNQLLTIVTVYLTENVRWRTTNQLRLNLTEHCLRLDMSFHNEHTSGEMISRVDEDVNVLSNFFSRFIIQILGQGLMIVGVVVILFREDWRIGLGFALLVILSGQVLHKLVRLAVPYMQKTLAKNAELFGFIEEALASTEDIRANGAKDYMMVRLYKTLRQYFVVRQVANALLRLTYSVIPSIFVVGTAFGIGLGGYLFQQNIVTIGTVYLIVNYSMLVQFPLTKLTQQLQDFEKALAAVNRIQDLFSIQTKIQSTQTTTLPDGQEALAVAFDHVSFHYTESRPVLQDVSFQLEPGEVMGLLGRTGSGKTTITRLLFRLYDPVTGQITLGGQPIPSVPLTHLREKVGIVTQEVQLFNATVRQNLSFFSTRISDEQILDAFHVLGLMPWYQSLSDGLDTELSPSRLRLSGGEAQLLAFARAFLHNPGLVILDEASSRLDSATETLIKGATERLLQNRTGIIIAHKLATIQRADKILILEDGQIKETGYRSELVTDPYSCFSQLLKTGVEEVLA